MTFFVEKIETWDKIEMRNIELLIYVIRQLSSEYTHKLVYLKIWGRI